MISLLLELPLLIGDTIPCGDKHYYSILLLVKISSIVLSPVVSHDILSYLEILTEEKLTQFKELYPSSTIISKMHYMVQYDSQLRKFGPLVNTWTMRHEAKLSFVKHSSQRSNFKVVSSEFYFHKPIIVHIELYLFYRFIHFLLYIGQY